MSQTARCLRSLSTAGKMAKRIPATRRYTQAQVQLKADPSSRHVPPRYSEQSSPPSDAEGSAHLKDAFSSPSSTTKRSSSAGQMAWHLNQLFKPLEFSEQLAHRALTHSSHPDAREGHNGAMSFIGRRTLESFLLLFLTSSLNLHRGHDLEHIIAQTISSPVLGQHIGSTWGLGRVMKWTPAVPRGKESKADALVNAGLWKVQGEAVTAVLGAVYHQFGASTSHKLFHTRMLPLLLLEGGRMTPGLPKEFHHDAQRVCEKMGGPDAILLSKASKEEGGAEKVAAV